MGCLSSYVFCKKRWLLVRFLEKNKGKKATTCEVLEYSNSAEVGGHVIIAGETAKGYILLIFY